MPSVIFDISNLLYSRTRFTDSTITDESTNDLVFFTVLFLERHLDLHLDTRQVRPEASVHRQRNTNFTEALLDNATKIQILMPWTGTTFARVQVCTKDQMSMTL